MTDPTRIQRLEGAALLAAATVTYFAAGFGWLVFVLLFFAFDLSALGYLGGPRLGAALYNLGHALVLPAIAALAYALTGAPWLLALTCLWTAHIGIDRMLSYGLKLPTGFKHTHLGIAGSGQRARSEDT